MPIIRVSPGANGRSPPPPILIISVSELEEAAVRAPARKLKDIEFPVGTSRRASLLSLATSEVDTVPCSTGPR